jgi:predicted esterase YcpF (UPF0227 family)
MKRKTVLSFSIFQEKHTKSLPLLEIPKTLIENMILYIHGYASSGESDKARLLRNYFKNEKIETPTLPVEPFKAIELLKELVSKYDKKEILLIGSSLGGFYASYLASVYNLHCILINPSTEPWNTLPQKVDMEYPKEYVEQVIKLGKEQKEASIPVLKTTVYLAKNDETIDYTLALKKFKDCNMIVTEDGGHRFVSFSDYLGEVERIHQDVISH